jgi:hypothetical protein
LTSAIARLLGCALVLSGCSEVLGFADPVQSTDAGASPASSPSEMSCSTHADCNDTFWDGPYLCREHRCFDLTTPTCPVVLGREHLDDGLTPLLFGAFSVTDEAQPLSHPVTLNYELALNDFVRSGGLLAGDRPALPLLIVCQGLPDSAAELDASIDHLVDTLSVPGIVLPIDQAELVRSFQRVLIDKGRHVLFLSTNGSDSLVTSLEDQGLLWHMLPGPLDVGRAYVPLVALVEQHLNRERTSDPRPPLRLALVISPENRFLDDLGAFLRTELEINGQALIQQDDTQYLALALPAYDRNKAVDRSFAVEALREFKPHLIVSAADTAFSTDVLPVLEERWGEVAGEQPPPFYVLSPYQNDPTTVVPLLESVPALRTRLVGVNVAGAADPTLYDLYIDRFRAEYPQASAYEGTENIYDAAYWLFYAAVASDAGRPLDGSGLSLGMTRLLSGPRFDVGPTAIAEASRYLRREPSASISLHGTLGPPDFDITDGTRHGVGSVWCYDKSLRAHYDVLRFDADSRELVGSFPCFEL